MYKRINLFLQRFFKKSTIFKSLFNISPMYRRSCGRIIQTSEDMSYVLVRIKLSWRNVNYNGSIFGGSLFSATDPIYMIQYIELLGHDYVVWDKSAKIYFKKPARETVYAEFVVTPSEVEEVKQQVELNGAYTFNKEVNITNKDKTIVYAIAEKEIYVATKAHYQNRRKKES